MRQTIKVDRGDVGVRIDLVLQRHLSHLPGVTRNRLQRLIDYGSVQVNGRPVARASSRVAPTDTIEIDLPERRPRSAPVAERLPLDLIYEDEQLLIVNKPAGQVSHPAFRNTSGTLLNAILAHAAGHWTPALVSRLDKGTSGLVLVAKSKSIHTALQRLSNDHGVDKEYLAVVFGKPPARGTIDLALDRDPWDRRRVTVRDRGGVNAVTKFERLRSAGSGGDYLSIVRCRLVTGRMHQIRVHLAAKGWPIAGDAAYGRKVPGMDRQALHAWRLAFAHPVTGVHIDATAPVPADMERLLVLFSASEVSEHRAQR